MNENGVSLEVGWTLDAPKEVGKIRVHFISNFLEKENTRVNTPMGKHMLISACSLCSRNDP
jgi:hypothetical protein